VVKQRVAVCCIIGPFSWVMADLAPGGLCIPVVWQVYAFDPTVPGLPESARNVTPRIQFFKQAIGPADGSSDDFMIVRSLPSIMKELGHTYIDVLKVRRLKLKTLHRFCPPMVSTLYRLSAYYVC
jgi:hypothetical protein